MAANVSLVIPGRNAAGVIRHCLDAVFGMMPEFAPAEVIFVNDGSTDETEQVVMDYPVRYLSTEGVGPAAARNLGWHQAKNELIWFIDADCVPEPDALARLLPHLDDHRVGGVGGSYGNLRPDSLLACLIHQEIVERHRSMPDEVNFLASFNVLYRREALEAVGGFDATCDTAAAEDAELAFRIRRAGYRLHFERHSRVGHFHPTCLRRYLATQKRHGFWRVWLYVRHPDRLGGDAYSGFVDHVQPPLAMLLLATLPFLFVPFIRWIPVGFAFLLVAAQVPMTWRVVRETRHVRYLHYASMSFVRAFWRGVGMTLGLATALWDRRTKPV